MREIRRAYEVSVRKRVHFEDLRIYGRIVIKWIFRKQGARLWTGFIWFRTGTDDKFL
jgi:hypothetical protein